MIDKNDQEPANKSEKPMSVAQYAAHRGVSREAVYRALDQRIAGAKVGKGKIDPVEADKLWRRNTDPVHGGVRVKRGASVGELRDAAEQLGIDADAVPDITDSRALLLAYQSELAKIELDTKRAELMPVAEHEKVVFKLARSARDAMLAIPDRLSAELGGITDPHVIHAKMTTEIRAAIDGMLAHAPD